MSIHKEGRKWRVKWKIAGRQRSRTFDKKADAITFDANIKRRRQLGPLLAAEMERESMTLLDYVRGPWRAHAVTLAVKTRKKYAWALDHLGELIDEPLIMIDAPMIAAHQRLMLDRDASASTVREVISQLSGILQIATEHGYIPANPARAVRNVPADEREEIVPLAPVELEQLIASLTGGDRAIALLAGHLGMRPLEVRLAPWSAFDGQTLVIGRSRTKATARRSRVIAVQRVTARELKAWQLASGGRGSEPIIGEMTADVLGHWGTRVLRPAVERATDGRITDATLYALRHTHASLCHYVSGLGIPEITRRLGHSPSVHFLHYAHVIDSISGRRYESLDQLIEVAQAERGFRVGSASEPAR
jgi:integrase